jgi:hypothetical protein
MNVENDGLAQLRLDGEPASRSDDDLEALVETAGGSQVMERPGLGRVVVASRDFAVGDIILRETPVLVWNGDDWKAFLESVDALPDGQKNGILDMFHPPLESACCRLLRKTASHLTTAPYAMEKRFRLMAIATANSHEYYGRPSMEYHETTSFLGSRQETKSALFLYASKVAHSCHPNAAYSSKTPDGKMEYKCIRPILTGDMVTFSYQCDLFQTSTPSRREQLQSDRDFLCQCPRCEQPDDARRLHCPNCTVGWALCSYDSEQNEMWICDGCGTLSGSVVEIVTQKEMEWTHKLTHLRMMVRMDVTQLDVSEATRGVTEAARTLSPTHHLVIQIVAELTRVAASQALKMDQLSVMVPPQMVTILKRRFGSPKDLRLQAATLGVLLVRRSECCAAQCRCDCSWTPTTPSSAVLTFPHAAVYECARDVFFVTRDLLEYDATARRWPTEAKEMIRRYIGLMKINFGQEDSDVADLERLLESTNAAPVANPTNNRSSTRGSSNKKKKGKKKKGRR